MFFIYRLWQIWLWIWLVGCLLIWGGLLLFQQLPNYRLQIEQGLQFLFQQPILIGKLETYWVDWQPALAIHQVSLPNAAFGYLEIVLDIKASLQQQQLVSQVLTIRHGQLSLARYTDGQIGFPTASSKHEGIGGWLLQQPNLSLQISLLHWLEPNQSAITFTNLKIQLEKLKNSYQLRAEVQLPPQAGMQVNRFQLAGEWSGQQGQGQIALEHLNLVSNSAKLAIAKLGGQIGIKRDHRWQVTISKLFAIPFHSSQKVALPTVEIQLTKDVRGHLHPLSLASLSAFLTFTEPRWQNWLTHLRGQLHDLQWQYDNQWYCSLRFAKVALAPWEAAGYLKFTNDQGTLELDNLSGTLTLPDLYPHPITLPKVQGKLTWQRLKNQWQLSADGVQLIDNGPKITAKGNLTWAAQQIQRHYLEIFLKTATIKQLQPYLPRSTLKLLDGQLQATRLRITGESLNQSSLELQSHFDKLHINYAQAVDIKGLSGHLQMTNQQGHIDLKPAEITVTWPPWYSHPLTVNQLQGKINWERLKHQWQFSTPKLQATAQQMQILASGRLNLSEGRSPDSHLTIEFHNGQLAQVPYYIPDRRLPKLAKWFKEAQLTGHLSFAKTTIKGALDTLFQNEASTRFEFKSYLNQAQVHYAQGWPAVTKLQAELVINKRQMTIQARQGRILNSQIKQLKIIIPDLSVSQPVLSLTGKTQGSSQDGLRFLANSPIRHTVALEALELQGQMTLQLRLKIPLASKKSTQIQGRIVFDQTQLHEKNLNLVIDELGGELTFNNHQIQAKHLSGKLLGSPIQVSLLKSANRTSVILTGKLDDKPINQLLQANLTSGRTSWQATLEFPNGHQEHEATDILIETDLMGMTLDLPPPLGKIASQALPLRVEIHRLTPTVVSVSYGNLLNALLEFNAAGFQRGSLLLGKSGELHLPKQPMLNIEGHLAELVLSKWQSVIEKLPRYSTSQNHQMVLNLHLDRLEAFGQLFENTKLQAQYKLATWQGTITSPQLEGQLIYRLQPDVLDLKLNHLTLKLPNQVPSNPAWSPHRLPTLTFQCKQLQVGELKLTEVNLTTQRTFEGLKMTVKSTTDHLNILAEAQWHPSQTSLQLSLTSENTQHLLQHLGFPKSPIEAGLTQFNLEASWPGSPLDFKLKTLTGTLSLLIMEGHVVEVEPGLGRIFGLFDMHTLPHRLALDFRDVFAKGLGFSTIVGFFSLQQGRAYTDNLILQAPAARIEIRGSTHLLQHTYQQTVTVIPHVSHTLPIAGIVAGGLGAGVIALVMQQILQEEIEKNIKYQYLITGPWDQPRIVPLAKQANE